MKRMAFIAASITLFFIASSLFRFSFFEFLELKMLDAAFTTRGALLPDSRIVIAAIDEKSLQKIGQWPWPRDKMAVLLKNAADAGAMVVAFDIVFAEPDRFGNDHAFAGEIRKRGKAVLGFFLDERNVVHNTKTLKDAAAEGYLNNYPDRDGVIRRISLQMEFRGETLSSLPLEAVSKFLGFTPLMKRDAAGNPTGIILGERVVPVDARGRTMINYIGHPKTYRYMSASDLLEGGFDASQLKNSIVLFGALAKGLGDIRSTPFSAASPGVEIYANIIDNILTERYLRRGAFSETINIASLLLIGMVAMAVFSRNGISASILSELVLVALFLSAGYIIFLKGVWIPVIYQILESLALFMGIMLYRYFTEGREKRHIHEAFKHYLAPAVIDGLLKDRSRLKLGGERREITVLFADVRNFTAISESIAPEKLVAMMNDYFTRMTGIIMKEGGMVDKYIGDAIMAFFGAPAMQNDHAARGCRAALAMEAAASELEAAFIKDYGVKEFKIGVGLNTGAAYVGNMGSKERFNYTAIGDSVNIASRMEGLSKIYGHPIIVSLSTKAACGGAFNFQSLGSVHVRGKAKEMEIFCLM